MASIVSAGTTSATALNMSADTSGVLQLASNNGTVAVIVDTSQKVGVGTTSPTQKLTVAGGLGFSSALTFTGAGYEIGQDGAAFLCFSGGSAGTRFIDASTATEWMRVDASGNLQFNSGYGSVAVAYGCRAWVNFNGTGTVAIRASGNVSSITDNGSGDYTVNFTTAMPDVNYSVVALTQFINDNRGTFAAMGAEIRSVTTPLTTSACRIGTGRTFSPYSLEDALSVYVAIFR